MVVEEDHLASAMEAALTRTPLRGEAHHTYRKIQTLRPMQDVGTMSARKFTSSPHEFTIDLVERDEPTLGDSQEVCAAATATAHLRHNSSTVSVRYA
jgi:hypothetical protein